MSDLSNYAENKSLDHLLGKAAWTMPTTVYLALYTAVTDDEAGTGTEVTGGSYARMPITATMSAAVAGASANADLIEFAKATAPWGLVTHACLRDALTGGNALSAIKALVSTKTIDTDDILRIPVGALIVSMA